MRIDKWLWAVRLYHTRSLASAACRDGSVSISGQAVKASRQVRVDDVVQAQTGHIQRTVKVLGLLENRVGAQAVREFALDLTPASEYEKRPEPMLQPLFQRPKGLGRPAKKDRRDLFKLMDKNV